MTEPESCTWPLTEQGIANVQNLHVLRCMSEMTAAQWMQTCDFISRILKNNDALEMEARCHRTAAGKFLSTYFTFVLNINLTKTFFQFQVTTTLSLHGVVHYPVVRI